MSNLRMSLPAARVYSKEPQRARPVSPEAVRVSLDLELKEILLDSSSTCDRMMRQLQRSGKLSKLAGLVIGGFTDTKDTERPFGQTAYEIIHEIVKEYDYPVCFGFPVSHEKENYALKVGEGYKLRVGKSKVTLEE